MSSDGRPLLFGNKAEGDSGGNTSHQQIQDIAVNWPGDLMIVQITNPNLQDTCCLRHELPGSSEQFIRPKSLSSLQATLLLTF